MGAVFTLVTTVTVMGAMASPAGAGAVPYQSTVQAGQAGTSDEGARVRPVGREPGALNLVLVATVGGPALMLGLWLACRPRMVQHLAVRRFRAQLQSSDLASVIQPISVGDHRSLGELDP